MDYLVSLGMEENGGLLFVWILQTLSFELVQSQKEKDPHSDTTFDNFCFIIQSLAPTRRVGDASSWISSAGGPRCSVTPLHALPAICTLTAGKVN
jgi:hypothetical protein